MSSAVAGLSINWPTLFCSPNRPMHARPTETELKLQLAAAHVDRLKHSSVLRKVCMYRGGD